MVSGFNGAVFLTWTTLQVGVLWLIAGFVCTLLTQRRGLRIAVILPLIVGAIPAIVRLEPPGAGPSVHWFPFGTDLGLYWTPVIVPFFASVLGALIGDVVNPNLDE